MVNNLGGTNSLDGRSLSEWEQIIWMRNDSDLGRQSEYTVSTNKDNLGGTDKFDMDSQFEHGQVINLDADNMVVGF